MNNLRLYLLVCLALWLVACAPGSSTEQLAIAIQVDGQARQLSIPAGSKVREALDAAGIELGELDRVDPPGYTQLADGDHLRVIRIAQEFETETVPMPFTSRTLPNEAIPGGEQRLIQNGVNGEQELGYRLVYEDGELISRIQIEAVVRVEPVEEIIMIGAQSPFSSLTIPGRLAFISGGNAWVLEGSSGSRRAVAITGDLDGRIFELSPDGSWLLFSRSSRSAGEINQLWVASLDEDEQTLIDLGVSN
ncbi:MAG: G5 domain-containing protein, partial [Anaerolineales bacterium]